jgi:hypothetical protein
VANSDPHDAIAVDRLHMNAGGNTSDHLWPEIQETIKQLGRKAIGRIDAE